MTGDAKRLEALVQAGLTLASELSLSTVLQKIIDLACEVADARYGALGVIGPEGMLVDFVTHGVTEEERRRIGNLPEGHGLLGVLIREAHPLRLRRLQDHPRSYGFPAHHPPMTSFLGVPIKVRERVFGNLYLTEKIGEGEFTVDDEEAVGTLATQAGVAIENARLYEESQNHQRRLAAASQVTDAILEGRSLHEVLTLIARSARELVSASLATVATPDPGSDEMYLAVAEGEFAEKVRGLRFPIEGSISEEVTRTRRPVILDDASIAPNVHQPLVALGEIGPAMLVPLGTLTRPFGTLGIANRRGGRTFTPDDLALVQMFASQAAVALEYSRVRQELERLALVEDRERIAKELHDGVVQSLFAVGMSLQAAEAIADDPAGVRKRLSGAVDDIDRAIRDLRNYIFALQPGEVADWQLARSLRELTASFADVGPAVGSEITPGAAARLTSSAADIVQAAREALSNAVRHASASQVVLRLAVEDGYAVLEVVDDGTGFDAAAAEGRGHGLGNLRDRARALGGELKIHSDPGVGTRVRIEIPM
ncbi:MAG TPA: GAF domain-containing sensor histidine kinase [Actinomycetota bacterium]